MKKLCLLVLAVLVGALPTQAQTLPSVTSLFSADYFTGCGAGAEWNATFTAVSNNPWPATFDPPGLNVFGIHHIYGSDLLGVQVDLGSVRVEDGRPASGLYQRTWYVNGATPAIPNDKVGAFFNAPQPKCPIAPDHGFLEVHLRDTAGQQVLYRANCLFGKNAPGDGGGTRVVFCSSLVP